jgi:tetratricopeptide (TPR) repeat protein
MLVGTVSFAQGRFGKDSADCVNYLNFYRDYFRQKNYKEAAPLWAKALKYCPPTASQYLYIHGQKILKYKIANYSGAQEGKEKLIDSLLMLSRIRAEYYPKYKVKAEENYVFDLVEYRPENDSQIFSVLDSVINEAGEEINPDILVFKMQRAIKMYKNKELDEDKVIDVYGKIYPIMQKLTQKETTGKVREHILAASKVLDNAFISSGVASCDNLEKIFKPRFDAADGNADIIKTIAKILSDNKCTDSDLFLNAIMSLDSLEPSSTSAYMLYQLNSQKGQFKEAMKYLEKAIETSTEGEQKIGEMAMELASYAFKNGDFTKAFSTARNVIDKYPAEEGKADYLIASIWASAKCNGNEIEKRAKYWVAVDYLVKAKKADPTLADECNNLIHEYSRYFPKTEDAFMYNLTDGQSYKINCSGMSASTTVRTIKK